MAIAALIVGIASCACAVIGANIVTSSLTGSIILLILAIVGGIVGIVLSAKTMKNIPEKKGFGIGGLVTSIIGLAYGAISLIACVACIACAGAAVAGAVDAASSDPQVQAELEQAANQLTDAANAVQ